LAYSFSSFLPPELDTADEAASTVDRATPCRLYRELSRRSTAAGSAAFTPTVPGSSGLATVTLARFPDWLGGGEGGVGDDGAGSTGAAPASPRLHGREPPLRRGASARGGDASAVGRCGGRVDWRGLRV